MTGYSRARVVEADFSFAVTVKTTNHRFLDLQLRLPAALEPLEPSLRRLVSRRVGRGHVEVGISLERASAGQLQLNRRMLEVYAAACRLLRSDFGFTVQPDPAGLLRIPGMVGEGNNELSPEELQRLQPTVERIVDEALGQLNQMRAREGETLERDLQLRLARLRELTEDIARLTNAAPQAYHRRLENRVHDLLGSLDLDRTRLAQEVAYLASRSDIAEELTRFRSHMDQAANLLNGSVLMEVGKRLDFLLQEMNREANTILSKTTDIPEVGLRISQEAIELKTVIEKLREQAQNIE